MLGHIPPTMLLEDDRTGTGTGTGSGSEVPIDPQKPYHRHPSHIEFLEVPVRFRWFRLISPNIGTGSGSGSVLVPMKVGSVVLLDSPFAVSNFH